MNYSESGRDLAGAPARRDSSVRRIDGGRADLGEGLPGRRILLDAVDLQSDQVDVRVLVDPGMAEFELWDVLYKLELADDVGTVYEEQSGGFMPVADGPSASHRSFRPAVPPNATELRITLAGPTTTATPTTTTLPLTEL